MTRKDYIAIAAILHPYAISAAPRTAGKVERERIAQASGYAKSIAHDMANHMAADNARFDRARFLKACGIQA